MHGGVAEDAAEMVSVLSKITGIDSIPVFDLPAAILVHGGPGAFGISFFSDNNK
jgi:fatty acid-binding protein DegV